MRRSPVISTCLALLLASANLFADAQPKPIPAPPSLGANSYVLMDYHSGKILAEKSPDERVHPASITKLMTAFVVFNELQANKISLDEEVTISKKAWRTGGSRMFVEVGKRVTVENLLKGMIIQSGNDACVALAEHTAGTEETFAAWMNRYAENLGMLNTQFKNATGLPNDSHYTTARDIAILSRALISRFPEYYKWYSQKEFRFNNITQHNRNKLLWRDDSVDGIKTGHTEAAGYCLASSAERDGMRLISVLLGASNDSNRASQSQSLLNYGFRFFETRRLYAGGEPRESARVWKGASENLSLGLLDDLFITIPRGHYDQLNASLSMANQIIAPVQAHDELGSVTIKLGDEVIAERPLVALQTVPEGGIWERARDAVLMWFE